MTVAAVAEAHAAALEAQIRVLRVQRAVLQAVARLGSHPQEMQTMHRLAQLSDAERKRIVTDFLDEAFAGLEIEPGFEDRMRSALPELPDDPAPEQVEAWIELAAILPAFGTEDRAALAARIEPGTDRRAERYWQLLAVINDWPPVPTAVPPWEWLIAALRVSASRRR